MPRGVLPPASTIRNRLRRSIARAAASRMRRYAACRNAAASATPSQRTLPRPASSCVSVALIPA
jgi:hypothetical protein